MVQRVEEAPRAIATDRIGVTALGTYGPPSLLGAASRVGAAAAHFSVSVPGSHFLNWSRAAAVR